MGNIPAKETRSRGASYSSGSSTSYSDTLGSRSGRRNTTSGVFSGHFIESKRLRRQEEKDKQRERHYNNLIVRFEESIDGGFLAPYGTYKSNLDYDTDIVRRLIIQRKLAPFFTPLQDFNESWSDEELLIILSQSTLHTIETAYSEAEEEEDDIDNHKIHKSQSYFRRQEQKAKLKSLITRVKEKQKEEENRFLEEKVKAKEGQPCSPYLFSKDLFLKLYRNASECPICFLSYPPYLNVSRCCLQPICTECFVQIKRLDPHPPHDDTSQQEGNSGSTPGSNANSLPHTLISEPAHCPYCAMPDFGVTYDPPSDIRVGIEGIKPSEYHLLHKKRQLIDKPQIKSSHSSSNSHLTGLHANSERGLEEALQEHDTGKGTEAVSKDLYQPVKQSKRRSSLASDAVGVITIDMIRPDWEQKLISARNKLARKAATASAIHASNLIIDQGSTLDARANNTRSSVPNSYNTNLYSIEERMIEEALRLSLLDEEERKKKAEQEKNKSPSS